MDPRLSEKITRYFPDPKSIPKECQALLQAINDDYIHFPLEREIPDNHLSDAFSHAAIGIALFSLEGRHLEVNSAYCQITGCTRDELLQTDYTSYTHPDDLSANQSMSAQLLRKEIPWYVLENRYLRKDGNPIWVRKSVSLFCDSQGNPQSMIAITEDVTMWRMAQKALEHSEELLEKAQAVAHVGSWVWELQGQDRLDWSTETYHIFGMNPKDPVQTSQDFYLRIHSDDTQRLQQTLQTAIDFKTRYSIEHRIVRPDHSIRWVHEQAEIIRDEKGRAVRLMGTVQDITERKALEDARSEEQELLRHVLVSIPHRVFWKDRNSVYLGCNQNFANDAGFQKPEELIGLTDYDLTWKKEEADFYRACDVEVMEKGRPLYDIEESQLRKDGQTATLLTSKVPLHDAWGQVIGILGMYMDITDRKQLETTLRQSDKMVAVGQLAAGVAHEINNPLGVILGFSQSLQKRLAPEDPIMHPLKSIEREALRCRNLVQNLLTFSRSKKPGMAWENPVDMVEAALSLIEAQARVRMVQVVRNYALHLPQVYMDSMQIQQVVINLCANAMDAMPTGGTLSIGMECGRNTHLTHGTFLKIHIQDTGKGIPADIRHRVFEPFFTTKEVGKGTGLGLSLAYEILKNHHGHIDVTSEVDKGTSFTAFLPLVPESKNIPSSANTNFSKAS